MTNEERLEIDLIHQTIRDILKTLSHINDDLRSKDADLSHKEGNLLAKQQHLNTLTASNNATRILLWAVQRVMASDPNQRAALAAAISEIATYADGQYLFTPMPDDLIAATHEQLDKLILQSLKPDLQKQQPPEN